MTNVSFAELNTSTIRVGVETKSAWWVLPFCTFTFLFFQGALTHLFGTGDGIEAAAPLGGLFTPIALAIQVITLFLLLNNKRRSRTVMLLSRNPTLLLGLGVIVFSIVWSIDPLLTARRVVALIGTTAVGILIYIEVGRENLLRFFAVYLAIFTAGSVLLAVGAPGIGTHQHDKFDGLWRGLMSFKNQAGWSAALFLLTWIGARKTVAMRSWSYPLIALGVLMLVQTGSATGMIAIVFGILVLAATTAYRQVAILRPIMTTLLIMLVTICLLDVQLVFSTALDFLGRDASLTGRTTIWSTVWPVIENKLLLGSGYLAFWDHASDYFGSSSWVGTLNHAHNAYIEILIDVGMVGLTGQALFLLTTLWKLFSLSTRHHDRDATAMFVIVLTLAVIGMAGALFFRANTGIWIMIVAVACYASDQRTLPAASQMP